MEGEVDPMPADESWTIVLIDDEEDIREVLRLSLTDAGYAVHMAADGRQGLRMCRELHPRIVITDVRMPEMDGLRVLESLKAELPEIEVVVATGFGEMDLAIRALQLGASDFITKPIHDDALHLALLRARERYSARQKLEDHAAWLERENLETIQELMGMFSFQRNLIDSSMDGIMACDRDGLIVTFNRAMERLAGYKKLDVIGKMNLDRLMTPGERQRFMDTLSSERSGGRRHLSLYEMNILTTDGRPIPVQTSAVRLFEGDREDGLVCFFRDLREIRRMEREMADQARILHQDKMMSLGRLAASVAHEINNPLAGILNYVRLMSRTLSRGVLSEERQSKFLEYLELIGRETSRCAEIVSSLLTFSRKSPPAFGDLRIGDLLERCAILSRHKLAMQNVHFHLDRGEDIPVIQGDANQLQQCVMNLIFNAVDAMPDGGELSVIGRFDQVAGEVVVSVADTGHGISEADRPHIFEPFFTTKDEGYGVGLGLSTVYGIVQRHNGSVSAGARKEGGTVFTLRLPG